MRVKNAPTVCFEENRDYRFKYLNFMKTHHRVGVKAVRLGNRTTPINRDMPRAGKPRPYDFAHILHILFIQASKSF